MDEPPDLVELPDLSSADTRDCRVCGKSPAFRCYGSIACSSCKVFFLRVTTQDPDLNCENEKRCASQNFRGKGKAKCKACRYEKCLEVGMIPEITARRTGCSLREKLGTDEKKRKALDTILTDLEEDQPGPSTAPDSREVQLYAKSYSNPLIISAAKNLPQMLVKMEKFLLNDDGCQRLSYDFKFHFDCPMAEALNNPRRVCSKLPYGINPASPMEVPSECMSSLGGRRVARSLTFFLDWVRSIREFWDLDEADRTLLCCRQYLPQGILTNYYYSYKYNFDGMLTILGVRLTRDQLPHMKQLKPMFELLLNYGLDTLYPYMRRLEMGDEELVLLRVILMFSHSMGYSEKSAKICKKVYKTYSNLLFEHLQIKYQCEKKAFDMFLAYMEVPNFIRVITHKMMPEFGRHVIFKEAEMGGQLTENIFCLGS